MGERMEVTKTWQLRKEVSTWNRIPAIGPLKADAGPGQAAVG